MCNPNLVGSQLVCDYLVIGSGAASLAFVDTLLTELPSAKIIMIDKKSSPGGHWVDAYDFVKLHQPSILYGVSSSQLEGNWLKCMLSTWDMPWKHRASKNEILSYYQRFIDEKVAEGQLKYYPCCKYDLEQEFVDDIHRFSSIDEEVVHTVKVQKKVVNGVLGECRIPSQCPVKFPVDENIRIFTPNKLYADHIAQSWLSNTNKNKKYVVLGCGKTAMDSVVFLQRSMKIKPENIEWVIPNDVWMINRAGEGGPWDWAKALLECNGDQDKASSSLEKQGVFVRLDKEVKPTKYRSPAVGKDELLLMQNVKKLIRRGRVTSLSINKNDKIIANFGPGQEPWIFNSSKADNYIFVHCTSPGPFLDNYIDELFVSEKLINLAVLFAPPVPISMSCLAYLEAARMKGTLDLDFGKQMLRAITSSDLLPSSASFHNNKSTLDNEILHTLIRGIDLTPADKNTPLKSLLRPIINLAFLFALGDTDPVNVYEWMKGNRLSALSIPDFKCEIYENLDEIIGKGEQFGYSEQELRMFCLVKNKIEPLKSK